MTSKVIFVTNRASLDQNLKLIDEIFKIEKKLEKIIDSSEESQRRFKDECEKTKNLISINIVSNQSDFLLTRKKELFEYLSLEKQKIALQSCAVCHKTSLGDKVNLLICGRCGESFYCGPECQKMDWPLHKSVCKLN